MAYTAMDGKKSTNRAPMLQHNRSLERAKSAGAGLMEKRDPLAMPGHEEPDGDEAEMKPHHAMIHDHLRAMHEETGEAHSHVEHHADGSHTSHHIDHEGQISGPHHHADGEAMAEHMKGMGGAAEDQGEETDEPEFD
jgi:hypothetical protein